VKELTNFRSPVNNLNLLLHFCCFKFKLTIECVGFLGQFQS
jgi:hypothetical protein